MHASKNTHNASCGHTRCDVCVHNWPLGLGLILALLCIGASKSSHAKPHQAKQWKAKPSETKPGQARTGKPTQEQLWRGCRLPNTAYIVTRVSGYYVLHVNVLLAPGPLSLAPCPLPLVPGSLSPVPCPWPFFCGPWAEKLGPKFGASGSVFVGPGSRSGPRGKFFVSF